MNLDFLLDQVKKLIFNEPSTPHNKDNDPGGLVGQIEGLFGKHREEQQGGYNVRPASEDPLGDPADLEPQHGQQQPSYAQVARTSESYPNLRPASEDPLGDPADMEVDSRTVANPQFRNLRPASEDPLGDPADQ